jgi:chromatin structure-remodeling complex protein RSC7
LAESQPQTPPNDEDDDGEQEQEDTPAAESDVAPPSPRPVKRRLGRPPKNRPPDWDSPRQDDDRGSEAGTPQKRKRGRPAGSGVGFRGRPRSSMVAGPQKVRVDREGTMMEVVNDEVDLPEDAAGEEKVDKLGNLKGGRDYRVRVFTVKNRGKRLYMLSTEPARCCGFRDSYLFFTKHLQLHKIIVEDDEKRDLIDREIIPHSYKGRSIGVVTARSVFREFGARIIIAGKRIVDDYYVQAAKERGDVEGELADPRDVLPRAGEPYNKNQYVAWHGASSVYHTGGPTVPIANGKPIAGKRKLTITSSNWQIEHARAARSVLDL